MKNLVIFPYTCTHNSNVLYPNNIFNLKSTVCRDSSSETSHAMMGTVLAYGKVLTWQ